MRMQNSIQGFGRTVLAGLSLLACLSLWLPCNSAPIILTGLNSVVANTKAESRSDTKRLRPIEVISVANGHKLFVANQKNGSVSLLGQHTLNGEPNFKIDATWKIAERLGGLIATEEMNVLASDQDAGVLVSFQVGENFDTGKIARVKTVGTPGPLLHVETEELLFVGGTWSRDVAVHHWKNNQTCPGKMVSRVELGFAVGQLVQLQSGLVVATDKFSSRWATLQFVAGQLQILKNGDLGSRRLCDLASIPYSGDSENETTRRLAVVTQPINRLAQAIRNDVHWGLMVANEVVLKDENWFVEQKWEESRRSKVPLGGPGEAKGDPESIVFSVNHDVAITIGGVNEVAVGSLSDRSFAYIPTGRRPVDSCFSADGKRLFVANYLDDSISVIDVEEYEVTQTILLQEPTELTSAERGERLFFDATVSHDSWMSCHSCHVEGHTSGFLNDNFSDQSFGAPKRVLSLLGHGNTAPFAWNGSAKTLEDQVRSSIEVTMQTDDRFSDEQIADLAAFVRQLPAPPSLTVARKQTYRVTSGKKLFGDLGCVACHAAPEYTTGMLQDVGLADELGKQEFNPPSLIGVSQRQSFFHDARYSSLEQLFKESQHQLERKLTADEQRILLEFLNTL